jgi:hypothetical protein
MQDALFKVVLILLWKDNNRHFHPLQLSHSVHINGKSKSQSFLSLINSIHMMTGNIQLSYDNDQWESVAFSYLYSYIWYRFTHTNNRQGKKEISRLQGYFKWTHTRVHTFVGRQIVLSLLKKQIFLKWLHRKNFTVILFEHQTNLE